MRNAHVVTIAPTGTISIIAGCSSGIEPLFSLAFTRQVLGGKKLRRSQSGLRGRAARAASRTRLRSSGSSSYAAAHGSIQDSDVAARASSRPCFAPPATSAPSGTCGCRLPGSGTRMRRSARPSICRPTLPSSDVEAAFLLAHELKCKGITVYRDGARPHQPMALTENAQGRSGAVASPVLPAP